MKKINFFLLILIIVFSGCLSKGSTEENLTMSQKINTESFKVIKKPTLKNEIDFNEEKNKNFIVSEKNNQKNEPNSSDINVSTSEKINISLGGSSGGGSSGSSGSGSGSSSDDNENEEEEEKVTYSILNETFDSGKNNTWYRVGINQPSQEIINNFPLNQNVLKWSNSNASVLRTFSKITLANKGDFIKVKANILYDSIPLNVDNVFSISLYNSNDSYVFYHSNTISPEAEDDRGYKFYKSITTNSSTLLLSENREFGSLSTEGNLTELSSFNSEKLLQINKTYNLSFTITRKENDDLEISGIFNKSSINVVIPSDEVISYLFDEISINLFAGDNVGGAIIDNIQVISTIEPEEEAIDNWLQKPVVLDNPIIISNYDDHGTDTYINGLGGDVLLLPHTVNGIPEVLKNEKITVQNFKNLHINGLDIEVDDPLFNETRVLLIRTTGGNLYKLAEEVFIEGLRIENNFISSNSDAIAVYFLGINTSPLNRFVLQNSRITGIGIPGTDDGMNIHPDILQFQSQIYINHIFIENFFGTTMYQGIFAPWNQHTTLSLQPEWNLRNVSMYSEDLYTNRLYVTQDEGYFAEEYPITTFENVYLSQNQTHPFGVGAAVVHVNSSLKDDSPYEFVPEARITGTPFPGRSSEDFAPREEVGIYYNSPHKN